MATTSKPLYGTATTVTCTLASLASDTTLIAGRQSAVADNTTDLAIDCLVGGKITTGTGPTAGRQIEVWCFGSFDGSVYSAGAGTADANFSPTGEKTLMKLLTIIPTDSTANHGYEWGPFSVAAAFGGTMPPKWGIFVVHNTGAALNSTGANHYIKYTPVQYQAV